MIIENKMVFCNLIRTFRSLVGKYLTHIYPNNSYHSVSNLVVEFLVNNRLSNHSENIAEYLQSKNQ